MRRNDSNRSALATVTRLRTGVLAGLVMLLAAGCNDGQLVDAGGERGQGGLAFVLLAVFFFLFLGALFYMDRVRQRRMGDDEDR
jgi:hypothetical protein